MNRAIDHECPTCGAEPGFSCMGGETHALRKREASEARRYASELTDIGEQLVIPGCERVVRDREQFSLWG